MALFSERGAVRKTPMARPIMRPMMVPTIEIKRVIPAPRKSCCQFSERILATWLKKLLLVSSVVVASAGCSLIIRSIKATWSSFEMVSMLALIWLIRLSSLRSPMAIAVSSSPVLKPGSTWTILNLELAASAVRASGRSET